MKTSQLFVLAVVITLGFGCKKGEEDPFLSFKSREKRMTGEFEISSYLMDVTEVKWGGGQYRTLTTFEGTTGTISEAFGSGPLEVTSNLTLEHANMNMAKDHIWQLEVKMLETFTDPPWGSQGFQTTTWQQSGWWTFLGKQKGNFKNKERVAYNYIEDKVYTNNEVTENTYAKNEYTQIFNLVKLGKDEILLTGDFEMYDGRVLFPVMYQTLEPIETVIHFEMTLSRKD